MVAAALARMCMCLGSSPAPNPYAVEQLLAVTALVFATILWIEVKPPAVRLLRVAAAIGAVLTSCAVLAAESGQLRDVALACRVALDSSVLLTSCLITELIVEWRRERLPRATARRPAGTQNNA